MHTVLLVDDNDFERRALGKLLNKSFSNILIEETNDGIQALEILKKETIKLLITDIKMPLIDGVELVKQVRRFEKKTKIVVVSGYDDFEYAKELLPYGVSDYLLKPINLVELKDSIRSLLEEDNNTNNYSTTIKNVIDIIRKEYSNSITLESVANDLGFSSSYLGILFNKEVGENFNHYLTNMRLQRAAELLSSSNIRIINIATYVGIGNPSYFNKVFKNKYSMTPAEFRKKEADRSE